jgi:putative mRNA 3-end processing factor
MELRFIGGAGEVGRSAVLLKTDAELVLDYGVKIHADTAFPQIGMHTVDAAIITHAHLDHSGFLPQLYDRAEPQWIATPPTKAICEILLPDSEKIMKQERGMLPYHHSSLKHAMRNFHPLPYGQQMRMGNTRITLHNAGHITGSAMAEVEFGRKRLLYTGDYNTVETYMNYPAKPVRGINILITESTYSDKEHPDRRELEKQLCKKIEHTLSNGGHVLLPAFAVGRTQELIRVIRARLRDVPIYIDGMGKDVTRTVERETKYVKDPKLFRRDVGSVSFVNGSRDRPKVLAKPAVIISTAGMLQGGPAMYYLLKLGHKSRMVFTGYSVPGTNAYRVLKEGIADIDGVEVKLKIPYEYMDFSAHAGRTDMFEFAKRCEPQKVFCVHGDHCTEFAEDLKVEGFDAVAPKINEKFVV